MENSKAKILIAEDDLVVARLQKFLLERMIAISPVMCKNGREAIDFLDRNVNEIDRVLVLLDLNMPEMNGWDFLEVSRERPYAEKVHVVIVTSSPYYEDEKKASSYEHVIGYYTKPITPATFQEILSLPKVASFFERESKSR